MSRCRESRVTSETFLKNTRKVQYLCCGFLKNESIASLTEYKDEVNVLKMEGLKVD